MPQPLLLVNPSAHHPSSTDKLMAPLIAAFIPTRARFQRIFELLIQTSTPATSLRASAESQFSIEQDAADEVGVHRQFVNLFDQSLAGSSCGCALPAMISTTGRSASFNRRANLSRSRTATLRVYM